MFKIHSWCSNLLKIQNKRDEPFVCCCESAFEKGAQRAHIITSIVFSIRVTYKMHIALMYEYDTTVDNCESFRMHAIQIFIK